MRVAYFSPLPPIHTGIADYSLELLPALTALLDVTLFVDEVAAVDRSITARWPVLPIATYNPQRWNFDATIYQLGNSFFHEAIYRTACRYPGITVLHDYNLQHFIVERTIGHGSLAGYRRELAYNLGEEGLQLGADIRRGKRALPLFEYPLNARVLDTSLGLIAHSEFVAAQVRRRQAQLPVRVIPHPMAKRPIGDRRHIADWPVDALIFASAGSVTPSRQIDLSLRAFAAVHQTYPQARYLIVGEWQQPDLTLEELLNELNLRDVVQHIGFVEDLSEFDDWIASADVLVNLRHPTVGETSGVVLRALAAGRPVIVSNAGWYGELPENCSLKVAPQDLSTLTQAMLRLAQDTILRSQMGQAASEYAHRVHNPAYAAARYAEFVQECVTRWRKPVLS